MKRFQSAPPRALAVFATLAMTAATLSASIIAPASVHSERRVAATTMQPTSQDYAFVNSGPLTTSIDVVAYRSTRAVTAAPTRAASRHDLAG